MQKHPNARVFAFGIGSSPNRFLLDNIARYGRGEVEYVGLKDDGSAAARRFAERVQSPLLTDISIDWGGLPVTELYPSRTPDLFAARPLIVSGRYSAPFNGVVRLHGKMAGRDFTREIRVNLPASAPGNDVLAALWARRKVDDLMSQDFRGMQYGTPRDDLKREITKLGLDYRLMTPFTSFVAVEEKVVTEGGEPRRVEVPVEMPEGVSYEGVFGGDARFERVAAMGAVSGFVGGVLPSMSQQVYVTASAAPLPPAAPAVPPRADPLITALIRRVQAGARPGVDETRFVFGGEAYIRITLNDASAGALDQLRRVGFLITRQEGNIVIGHAPVAKVEAISKLPAVAWIAPR